MKKVIAFILSVMTVVSVCALSLNVSAKESAKEELYAAVVGFDNFKNDAAIKYISGSEGVTVTTKDEPVENPGDDDHPFLHYYHTELSGEGLWSFSVSVDHVNFYNHKVYAVVLDTKDCDQTKFTVTPVLTSGEEGSPATYETHNGAAYFRFSEPLDLKAINVSVDGVDLVYITQAFFASNDYSTKFVIDNNVLPSTATPKRLIITSEENGTAINYANMTEDEKDVSKGGMYFSYECNKWPSIDIDENGVLYCVASGCREEHTDPFGSTVLVTSEDGGKTWSAPRQICNTINDDRDTGIVYCGNGKLVVSFLNCGAWDYLRDHGDGNIGSFFYHMMRHTSNQWDAEKWTQEGYPIGGIKGNYADLMMYVHYSDPDYDIGDNSNVIVSYDYGKTWSVQPYELKETTNEDMERLGVELTPTIRETLAKYQITENGYDAPVRSPHGPRCLSDGSLLWVGERMKVGKDNKPRQCWASYDDGKTWVFKSDMTIPCYYSQGDFPEPDITETQDGVIIAAFRSFETFLCYSYDKGATWTTMYDSRATADGLPLEGQTSQALTTLKNGNILLTTAVRDEKIFGAKKIYAFVSEDGGRTWSEKAVFKRGFNAGSDMGYPGNAELADGSIITCYYDDAIIGTTTWKYELVDARPNSWVKTSIGWRYYDENVKPVTKTWIADGAGSCYIDNYGYMVAGRSVKDGGKYVLVDDNGHKVTNKTGWVKVSSGWYYLQAGGNLKVNCWMKDSKGWCFLSSTGLMQTNRSVKDSKGYCLVDASGYWVTKPGWQKAGNDWYYVEKGGYLKVNGWMKDSKGWCYLASDGPMKTSQTVADSKGLCLVDESGYWVTKAGWKKVGANWYYVENGGYLKTDGWMNDSQGWCYLGKDGAMLTDIAVKDSKGWCILDGNGYWLKSTPETGYFVRESYTTRYGGGLAKGMYHVNSKGYIIETE